MTMEIETGYKTGLIADVVSMHARFYASEANFGHAFEAVVASGLADFVLRLQVPCNEIWHVSVASSIKACVAIDGQDLSEGIAHLRWFIVDDCLRGSGIAGRLLDVNLSFCKQQGFQHVHLWTFSGLHAARHLYEQRGFRLVEEMDGDQWGKTVREQKFCLTL